MGRLNYGLFLSVVALLPFPQLLLRYACVAWIISWFLEGRWLQKPLSTFNFPYLQIVPLGRELSTLLFGLWFLWHIVSGLWAPDQAAWSEQIERYLAFGLLVPVGIWGVNERYNTKQIGQVLIGACLCAVVFYPAILTFLLHHREFIDVRPSLHHLFWDYSSLDWWDFFVANLTHIKHTLFLCSIFFMAAFMAFELYRDRWRILIPIEGILLSFILLTGSRQALLTGIILLIAILIKALPIRWRRYSIGIGFIGLMAGIALLALHPRMQTEHLNQEPRAIIWRMALEQPQDYIAYGLGGGQSTDYLTTQFEQHNAFFYSIMHYHCHNQYLEEMMELGIGGLILFLLAWLSIPLCADKKSRRTAWFFCLMMLLNMCTESMFAVFCGVALWAVSMILIRLQSDGERQH